MKALKNTIRFSIQSAVMLMALVVFAGDVFALPQLPPIQTDDVAPSYRRAEEGVAINEKLQQMLPLETELMDHTGKKVKLGDYFKDGKPVVLNIVYYGCPGLCTVSLDGMFSSIRHVKLKPGQDYKVLVLSMDPREHPPVAAKNAKAVERDEAYKGALGVMSEKRKAYLIDAGMTAMGDGIVFLSGAEDQIKKVTEAVGFEYRWDEKTQQYLHGAALVLMTPEGLVGRYLYGGFIDPMLVRLSLVEVGDRKIGSIMDQIQLYCSAYNKDAGGYVLQAMQLVKIGGLITVLAILSGFGFIYLYEKRRAAKRNSDKVQGGLQPAV